jgi:hypothetical protein
MTRRRRSVAAFFAAFALVFAQLAVSAHACVLHEASPRPEVMTHHEGCAGAMEADEAEVNGNVCAGHCQYGNASVDNAPLDAMAADPAGPVLRVERVDPALAGHFAPSWRLAPAAAPPPPAILFGVLRI